MKRIVLFLSLLLVTMLGVAQVTLEDCQRKTQANYPLVRQYDLIEQAKEFNLANASKGYLPQFALSAKATYQSAVTALPVQIPGVDIKRLPKDQYQVMLELRQTIWDGGAIRSQKEMTKAASDVDREKLNVDMYALTDRVNQLYFGILLLDERLVQNRLLQDELGRSLKQISAYMENGIANQADVDAVKVEQLNTKQKRIELAATRQAYLDMLSLFVGGWIASDVRLVKPGEQELSALDNNRPELLWFEAQNGRLQVQEEALRSRNMPVFGLFVQGAYGNPGLNMLKNEFTPYYIAGVRMSWNFGSLYTLKNDRRLIDTGRRQLESNRDIFVFNTRLQATQQNSTVMSMRKQMADDEEIIRLRANIRKAAEAKVANGTLTVTEMLREITAESLARQTKAMHEIQLLMNIYQLKYIINK